MNPPLHIIGIDNMSWWVFCFSGRHRAVAGQSLEFLPSSAGRMNSFELKPLVDRSWSRYYFLGRPFRFASYSRLNMNIRIFPVVMAAALLAGCASSSVVVGRVRPAISPTQVKLYLQAPAKYEEVALLETSSQASLRFTDQSKMDVVVERMKAEAAKLGANGVLLRGTGDRPGASIGTGSFSGGFGLGVSTNLMHKAGSGVAIYVEPN